MWRIARLPGQGPVLRIVPGDGGDQGDVSGVARRQVVRREAQGTDRGEAAGPEAGGGDGDPGAQPGVPGPGTGCAAQRRRRGRLHPADKRRIKGGKRMYPPNFVSSVVAVARARGEGTAVQVVCNRLCRARDGVFYSRGPSSRLSCQPSR